MSITINNLVKKIIKDNPRVMTFASKDRILKQVVSNLYPESYKKISGETWELIILDLRMANYEIEKILRN